MAILKCSNPNCNNEYQDAKYGKHMRVANPCKDGDSHRCTVCDKELGVTTKSLATQPEDVVKKKKKK